MTGNRDARRQHGAGEQHFDVGADGLLGVDDSLRGKHGVVTAEEVGEAAAELGIGQEVRAAQDTPQACRGIGGQRRGAREICAGGCPPAPAPCRPGPATAGRSRSGPATCGSQPFLHFENVVGNQSVSLAMYGVRGLRRRCVDQAEDLAVGLTHPVAEVPDVMRALRFEVRGVAWATPSTVAPP
jgi:hypothetical protein